MASPAVPQGSGEAIGGRGGGASLRTYQIAALEAVSAAFSGGLNRLLIKKPTGTGKTVMFAAMLRWPWMASWLSGLQRLSPTKGAQMLVIAHREELLDQAAEKISRQNPGLMVSIEQGDRKANRYCDVIVAGIQTLQAQKFKRLKKLLQHHTFRIVVVDEAHHAAAASYRTALVHLGFLPPADASEDTEIEAIKETDVAVMTRNLESWDAIAPKDRLLVGVTATPNRSDAIGLGCVFQSIAYAYDLKTAIDDGYLVPIVPWVVETNDSLDAVKMNRGDFNQRDLADAVNNMRRNTLAVEAWTTYAGDLQTIAFTVDIAHAHNLADAFTAVGIKARALSGKTPKEERRAILRDYASGAVQVITNCMVLTEGTDLPKTGCILHAKPTKSATLYEQMTGRGLRVHPNDPVGPARLASAGPFLKPNCIVIDMVDIARRHSLMRAPVLYGLPPNLDANGKDLKGLADGIEAFLERFPGYDIENAGRLSLESLEVRASTFDIWKIPALGPAGEGLRFQWIRTGDDSFRLSYPWADGFEILTVTRDVLGHYELVATIRPADKSQPIRQRTIVGQAPSAKAALLVAETFVLNDRRNVTGIVSNNAPWRRNPATQKQISRLRGLGAPIKPSMTIAEASQMIDLYLARRRK